MLTLSLFYSSMTVSRGDRSIRTEDLCTVVADVGIEDDGGGGAGGKTVTSTG
jgi:hypothetical protein